MTPEAETMPISVHFAIFAASWALVAALAAGLLA